MLTIDTTIPLNFFAEIYIHRSNLIKTDFFLFTFEDDYVGSIPLPFSAYFYYHRKFEHTSSHPTDSNDGLVFDTYCCLFLFGG